MVALIRNSLKDAVSQTSSAHAGLLLSHSLPIWEQNEKIEKSRLIAKITGVSPCELYKLAFSRWLATTSNIEQFGFLTSTLSGRLMMGLNTGGAIETGISVHHSYGMPMIAGSSVKGAVRAYAEKIGLDKQYIAVLFGADDELAKEAAMPESAGYLVWHDAWWVPEGNNKPFVGEIVTVHHQDYYAGNGAATDFDSPVPNQQLAIQGSFYFVVEGDTAWVNLAINLLRGTLKQQGIGSKRAAGYGFMSENTELKDKLSKKLEEDKEQARKEQEATKLLAEMASLTDNQKQIQEFVIKLSKNSTWQTGQAGNDKGGFLDIYNQVSQWENSEDIKFAIKMFEEQVLKWLKISKLNQNPNWRDKINTLKRKVGLL